MIEIVSLLCCVGLDDDHSSGAPNRELDWILIRMLRALREANKLSVHVENPAKWYAEVITP